MKCRMQILPAFLTTRVRDGVWIDDVTPEEIAVWSQSGWVAEVVPDEVAVVEKATRKPRRKPETRG